VRRTSGGPEMNLSFALRRTVHWRKRGSKQVWKICECDSDFRPNSVINGCGGVTRHGHHQAAGLLERRRHSTLRQNANAYPSRTERRVWCPGVAVQRGLSFLD